jgi:hypothetical protein
MDDILLTFLSFLFPFVGAVLLIVKAVRDYHKAQQIYSELEELDGNVYIDSKMDSLSNKLDTLSQLEHPHKSHKLTNCKNCGAVLHSNKCEFCGTEYDW